MTVVISTVGGYVRGSVAWNAPQALGACAERIIISKSATKLAVGEGELALEWPSMGSAPELRLRHDCWDTLVPEFSGLLRHMSHLGAAARPEEYCALLARLGFADATQRIKPRDSAP